MGVLLLPGHAVHACSVCRMLRDASPRHPRRSEVGKFDRKDNRGSALLRGTQWWSIPLPFSLFGRIIVADHDVVPVFLCKQWCHGDRNETGWSRSHDGWQRLPEVLIVVGVVVVVVLVVAAAAVVVLGVVSTAGPVRRVPQCRCGF